MRRRRGKIAWRIFQAIGFLGLVWGTSYHLYSHKRHIDFEHISVEHGLSQSTVQYIFQDSKGFLWVCTEDGLNRYDGYDFKIYKHETDNPHSLGNNSIRTMIEDRSGFLWIGTFGGGVNRFDRGTETFIHYQEDPENPNSLSNNRVMSIYEDRKGIIWLGTYGGLNKFDRKNETFIHYQHDPRDPASLSNDRVIAIYGDRSGALWIGTLGELNIFNPQTEAFTRYLIHPGDLNTLSDRITSIVEDRRGYLWVGTVDGLNRLEYTMPGKRFNFTRYLASPGNPGSLSSNKVIYIYEDRVGTLWIGTDGGLDKYRRNQDTFIHYKMKDGLPNDVIYGILEDDHGNLWISTNNGLSKFDPGTEVFKNYDSRDGLQSNEFMYGACCRSTSGEMIFGGINGLNVFFPDSIRDNPHKPFIVFTDLQIFNKPVGIGEEVNGRIILRQYISATREIKLSYRHTGFSFEYAGLHYAAPDRNQYAYKMEGLEKEWNDVGNRRFATYAHLAPGKYVFRVKGSNNDGVWNETGASIKIVIPPHPGKPGGPIRSMVWFLLGLSPVMFVRRGKNWRMSGR